MPRSGLWVRIFVGLLLAIVPPIVAVLATLLLADSILAETNPSLVAVGVVGLAAAWAAILAIVYGRNLADEYRSLVSVARRGDGGGDEAGAASHELAMLLDERNRQVATLAEQASNVPIDDEPRAVVAALVSTVRRVMRDSTWRCAVLVSDAPELLPPGVYHGVEDGREPDPVGDLEGWASTTGTELPARHVAGPWGAFAVADLAVSERLRAILYAPWEGRMDPTRAEIDLLRLVGEHAGTALEHSMLYAQVRQQADALDRLNRVQADFLRGVTHDLQTPLTRIAALANELRAGEGLDAAERGDLDSIVHQAERLRRMVSQLLVASRIEAGVLVPRQEVFAVRPLVERTWTALRAEREFALSVDGPPHLAVGDPDRLEQVLWAILDNAVKYSPPGSPIEVRIGPEGDRLAIAVRDRGAGMDEATRVRAFDQFYRSPQARTLAPDGSGVGLYAARGLMAIMGGDIRLESRLGSGTQVVLEIPAEPAEDGIG